VNQVCALQRWHLQTGDLCAQKVLESSLGQEQRLSQTVGVADGCADVVIGQVLKRVELVDRLDEHLRENELNPRATDHRLPGVSIPALNELNEVPDILRHQTQNQNPLRFLISDTLILPILLHPFLLGLQQVDQILPNNRQLRLDMLNKHHIKRPNKRLHPQPLVTMLVLLVPLEKLRLSLALLIDGEVALHGSQVDASVA